MGRESVSKPKPETSICIVNWNAKEDLYHCLLSLAEQDVASRLEIIVVDNDSSDHSAEMVQTQFPHVGLIANNRNLGFATANNQAVRQSSGEFLLILNPDTIVMKGALQELASFMHSHPQASAVGPKLLNADGSLQFSCRKFPNLGAGFFRQTPLGRLFPNNRFTRNYLMTAFDHDEPREVDWVSGAAMLVRSKTVQDIGMMDERFFMYCEDVDWCWRMKQAGWTVWFCPGAQIKHAIGKSSDQQIEAMIWERHKSMWRFFTKNYRHRYSLVLFPLIGFGLGLRCGSALLRVVLNRALAIAKGAIQSCQNLSR